MNIEKLKQLGLSEYEAKCYLTLIKHNYLSASEIANKTKIPPTSVHRNLYSLIDKKFIYITQKEPMLFKAIKPEIAIETFIQNKQKELNTLKTDLVKELKNIKLTKKTKEKEVLNIAIGREQTYMLCNQLIQKANKEILIVGGGRAQAVIDTIHRTNESLKNNVKYHLLIGRKDTDKEILKELKQKGVIIKYFPTKDIRLIISDKKETLLIVKNSGKRIALQIMNNELSKLFADYFYNLWEKAKKLDL